MGTKRSGTKFSHWCVGSETGYNLDRNTIVNAHQQKRLPGAKRTVLAVLFLSLCILREVIIICNYFAGAPILRREFEGDRGALWFLRIEEQVEVWVSIGTVITFLLWVYVSHANLARMGVEGCRYSPGWAIAYFFIPIVNLFRPFQAMNELWKASDEHAPGDADAAWRNIRSSTIITWWWVIFVLLCVMGIEFLPKPLSVFAGFGDAPWYISIIAAVLVLYNILAIIAAVLAISMIRRIRERQCVAFQNSIHDSV
jgi:hypothetical protein